MPMQRCPKCNKILSPQESVCTSCGARVNNHDIGRINSIYHSSNVATLVFLLIFFIGALLYAFVHWIVAVVAIVVLAAVFIYFRFIR